MSDNDFYKAVDVFARWNPAKVPVFMRKAEYSRYVPRIIEVKNDYLLIVGELEIIISNDMGLFYNSCNLKQKKYVEKIAKKFYTKLND